MTITDWVQAVSSAVLVLVTLYYVVITNKMLHVNHRAFLKPTKLVLHDNEWNILIYNFGPSLATEVVIRTQVINKPRLNPTLTNPLRSFAATEIAYAKGLFEVKPEDEATYKLSCFFAILLGDPIFIKWRSITGQKQKTTWIYQEGTFIKATLFRVIRFQIKWIFIILLSPFLNRINQLNKEVCEDKKEGKF